jgi:energy-coupling factor transporter ATP-binding protein EcfA2
MYFGAANPAAGYLLNPGFGGLNGYYYWTPGAGTNPVPTGPSYSNPGPIRAVGALPAPLQAPGQLNASEEWTDARVSFTAASAKVSSARLAVEELRARLESIGQSPRANLSTNTVAAEAALKLAQERMTAGNLEESLREIQRANYLAAQVLKEFGR